MSHTDESNPPTGNWETVKPPHPAHDPVDNPGFETICEHYGEDPLAAFGAAAPPIYQASTFVYPDADAFGRRLTEQGGRYDYTRGANPTTSILEAKLARLEKGTWCECFGSGMGAISAAINACVKAGSHVVCVGHCYGPTRWFINHLHRFGVTVTWVNSVKPEDFIAAIRPETAMIYLESPTSGRFEMPEIEPITAEARKRGITTAFDNSWATPYFCNPLDMGIDLVLHSASKYLNGHSDIVAGVLVGRDKDLHKHVTTEVTLCGAVLDPFAAWLMMRGLRTLAVRMEQHQKSAMTIANFLESHSKVEIVRHPGLESHPEHAVARKQLRGFSGLFSFELKDTSREAVVNVLNRLKLFRQAVSWGGFESLIIGGTMFSDRPDRPQHLLRMSVGLESTEDLVADLKRALDH